MLLKKKNLSFKNIIRNFTKYITNTRDDLLKKSNIDINDWISNNLNNDIIIQVNNNIKKIIQDLDL